MPNFDRSRPAPVDLLLQRDGASVQVCEAADDAIERLYAHYREELHIHALRLVGSPDLADDAVQQAFSNTLVAVRRGANIDHAARWLHTSVRNACIDCLREQQMLSLKEAEDVPAKLHLADVVDAREQVEAIRHAVGQLPDHLRAALILADVHGFSYQEVATRMQRSVASVRQLIFRARSHVREMTEGGGLAIGLPALALLAVAEGRDRLQVLRDAFATRLENVQAWLGSLGERVLGGVAQTAAPIGGALLITVAVAVQQGVSRPTPAVGVHASPATHDARKRVVGPRPTLTHDSRSSSRAAVSSGFSGPTPARTPLPGARDRIGEPGMTSTPPMRADRRESSSAVNLAGAGGGGAWGSSPPIAEPPTEGYRPPDVDPPPDRTEPQLSQGHQGGQGGDSPGGALGPEAVPDHADRIDPAVGASATRTGRSMRPGPVSVSLSALPQRS